MYVVFVWIQFEEKIYRSELKTCHKMPALVYSTTLLEGSAEPPEKSNEKQSRLSTEDNYLFGNNLSANSHFVFKRNRAKLDRQTCWL